MTETELRNRVVARILYYKNNRYNGIYGASHVESIWIYQL